MIYCMQDAIPYIVAGALFLVVMQYLQDKDVL